MLGGGCPSELYSNTLDAALDEIDMIREDSNLTAQEMRIALAELGISERTINALLIDERLANQYGGDLRSAYAKVVEPDLKALTPDEIQIYGDEASAVDSSDDLDVELTDNEALTIRNWFERRNVATPAELVVALEDSSTVISDETLADTLEALFIDFDSDLLLAELP